MRKRLWRISLFDNYYRQHQIVCIFFTAHSLHSFETQRALSILFIVFSPERGENTMNQALREKQKIPLEIVDSFIRIPLSGILIKFLSLRSRRLRGEMVFRQE